MQFMASKAFPTDSEKLLKAMDPRQASGFDPLMKHTSDFSRLRSLDQFPALGLSAGDFWPLFSRCLVCCNLMTTRTIPYHMCQTGQLFVQYTGATLISWIDFL